MGHTVQVFQFKFKVGVDKYSKMNFFEVYEKSFKTNV